MPAKTTPLDLDYIVEQNRAGRSLANIARELQVDSEALRLRLKRAGTKLIRWPSAHGKPRVTDGFEDEIIERYRSGESILELATHFNIARRTVDGVLKKRGITKRTAGEQQSIQMSKLTPEQRLARAAAAHKAVTGNPRRFSSKVKNALAKQASQSGASEMERMVQADLEARGIQPIPQLAIGPYNCDLACYPVAVEIFGGNFHFTGRHLARSEKRIRDLGDAGWHVLMLVISSGNGPAYTYAADTRDYLIAYIQQARTNPAARREYRVIDCRGETLAGGCCDDSHVSIKPAFANRRDPATGRYERVPR